MLYSWDTTRPYSNEALHPGKRFPFSLSNQIAKNRLGTTLEIDGYEYWNGTPATGPVTYALAGRYPIVRLQMEGYTPIVSLKFLPESKVAIYPILARNKVHVNFDLDNISKKVLEEKLDRPLSEDDYRKELQQLQEDALDPGGYFISNGTERVLITVEDLAPNRVLVERSSRYGSEVEVAKVFSQRVGYRALTVVEKRKDCMLMVSLPTTYGQIPLIVLLRALGMENDKEIVDVICVDPMMEPYVLANIEECAKEYSIATKEEAVAYLGKKFAGGQAKEYRVKRVETIMDRHLLAHSAKSGVPPPPVPRIILPGAPRSTMPPIPATAASW